MALVSFSVYLVLICWIMKSRGDDLPVTVDASTENDAADFNEPMELQTREGTYNSIPDGLTGSQSEKLGYSVDHKTRFQTTTSMANEEDESTTQGDSPHADNEERTGTTDQNTFPDSTSAEQTETTDQNTSFDSTSAEHSKTTEQNTFSASKNAEQTGTTDQNTFSASKNAEQTGTTDQNTFSDSKKAEQTETTVSKSLTTSRMSYKTSTAVRDTPGPDSKSMSDSMSLSRILLIAVMFLSLCRFSL